MTPIRRDDGTGLDPKGFTEVRKGDGTVLWSAEPATPDSENLQSQYVASSFNLVDGEAIDEDWVDDAGGNDASVVGAPIYRSDEINGEPAIEFDGADDYFDTGYEGDTDDPQSLYAVISVTDADNKATYYGANDGDNRTYGGTRVGGQWAAAYADELHEGGSVTEAEYLITATVAGSGDVETFENGSSEVSGSYSGQGVVSEPDYIGSLNNGSAIDYLDGHVAEILRYDAEHDSQTRGDVESYLNSKYGIF